MRLQEEADREMTLRAIVHAAVDLVPAVNWAGISLVQGKRITSAAPSHRLVAELDRWQSDLSEGPCLTAIREQAVATLVRATGKPGGAQSLCHRTGRVCAGVGDLG
ncbi:hypothetical protein H4W33_009870 [Kibdelosporangium phytohabitans]|uniref:Uncharacterized protein n=1 Tax=Kibdelosporangium phytohabitans TaxID=860235 RepID=A0A0N9HXI3_9PSEU|nr:hypothetical protein [Kibdelosporangium phytohabitans]ALG08201.1 hypothetical protein AOZ06_15945 [Kibdelosporangium phytohabitans]MBE1470796.1 hypothetical protein [Kibdelosporangium phytohabitans]